jgi:hypothetical protein
MMKRLKDQVAGKKISLFQLKLQMEQLINVKASPSMSPDEPPSLPTASDTTSSTSEDEDTPADPPKRSWVKHNHHPPQQLLGTINEGRRLRSRVIQPNSEVANQVSYSCYLAQTEPKKLMKPYRMKVGCLPCMMSSINSLEMMFGPWFPVLQNKISLVLSEFSRIKQMSMALWFGIKPVLLPRDTLR